MLAGVVSFEASHLGLQMDAFSLCPHMAIPLAVSSFPLLKGTPVRLD